MNVNDSSLNNKINISELKQARNSEDIELDDISIIYTTELQEDERAKFKDTFKEVPIEESMQAKKFLSALKTNKEDLCNSLGLSTEQYDSLACIAMGLASQETGFGEEKGYQSENTGIGKLWRGFLKQIDVLTGGASASSGLTQMKIYDFLNGDKLTAEQKDILKEYGIEAEGVANNNLYENPDKAAIATLVVLKSIYEKYDDYENVLAKEHENVGSSLSEKGYKVEEIDKKGNEILSDIYEVYQGASDDKKMEIRKTLKSWFLSQNGSKIGDKKVDDEYNEELQLQKLNTLLSNNSSGVELESDSLDFLRYVLTDENQKMNVVEYCAYGWNKGTGSSGMQLDRMLAEKIGTLLYNPENFDYDQFTTNVSMLSEKYAEQSVFRGGIDVISKSFIDETT